MMKIKLSNPVYTRKPMQIICGVLVLWLCLSAFVISAAPRLAIVSKAGTGFQDLLIARLSSLDNVELVERGITDKILREQKVSTAGLNTGQVLALGKLLGADIFAVIEYDEKRKELIGCIVFDAESGVRYWDSALPEEPGRAVDFVAESIATSLEKFSEAQAGTLEYLSLAAVRNAGLPIEQRSFCRTVAFMLMRNMVTASGIAVLERSHLDWLTRERNLPGIEWRNSLISATKQLELEISPVEGKQLQASIFVSGEEMVSVVSETQNEADLAGKLAAALLRKLSAGSVTYPVGNRRAEGRRLMMEYRFLKERGRFAEAREKIGAYHALFPDEYCPEYIYMIERNPATMNIAVMERELANYEYAVFLSLKWEKEGKETLDVSLASYADFVFQANLSDDLNRQAMDLRLEWMKINKRRIEQRSGFPFDRVVTDFDSYRQHSRQTRNFLVENRVTALIGDEAWDNGVIPIYRQWLLAGKQYADSLGDSEKHLFPEIGLPLLTSLLSPPQRRHKDFASLSERRKRKLQDLFLEMKEHPIPPISVAGQCGLVLLEGLVAEADSEYWISKEKEIAEFTMQKLAEMGKDERYPIAKNIIYHIACEAISPNMIKKNSYKNVGEHLFDFMVARNELASSVAIDSIGWGRSKKLEDNEYTLYRDRALAILAACKSSNTNLLYKGTFAHSWQLTEEVSRIANGTLDRIYQERPELRPPESTFSRSIEKFDHFYSSLVVSGNSVYALFSGKKLILKEIIPGMASREITELPFNYNASQISVWKDKADPAVIYNNRFIWGSSNAGLYIVPLDGGKPYTVDKKFGLASNCIQAFACLDDQVLLATGAVDYSKYGEEFSLYLYHLETRQLKLLSSSGRRTRNTPFDNLTKPVIAKGMLADTKKNRILFAVGGRNIPQSINGIWEYSMDEGKFEKIPNTSGYIKNFTLKHGKMMLESDFSQCCEFIPEDNRLELIFSYLRKSNRDRVRYPEFNASAFRMSAPFLLGKQYLWAIGTGVGFSRLNLKTGAFERLSPLALDSRARFTYLNTTRNGKYLVAADRSRLYLIELNDNEL